MSIIDTVTLKQMVQTGERYVSPLPDIDALVGNKLAKALDSIREHSNGSELLLNYTKRHVSQKLFMCNEPDPKTFVLRMRQKHPDPSSLPAVYFHRIAGVDFVDDSSDVVQKAIGTIDNDDGTTLAILDRVPVMLNYSVYVVGWDQISLHKLACALTAAMSTSARNMIGDTTLLNAELPTEAYMQPGQLTSWVDMSLPAAEDRLLCLQAGITVRGEYFQANVIEEKEIQVAIAAPQPFFSKVPV